MKLLVLTMHGDNAEIYVVVDKVIAFIRPPGKAFTEVLVQQTHSHSNTLGPVAFYVNETLREIADQCASL
jgi:hypothetical protein